MDKKTDLAKKSIQDTNDRISTIQNYRNKFNDQIATYEKKLVPILKIFLTEDFTPKKIIIYATKK